jgi:hypothetical protein
MDKPLIWEGVNKSKVKSEILAVKLVIKLPSPLAGRGWGWGSFKV